LRWTTKRLSMELPKAWNSIHFWTKLMSSNFHISILTLNLYLSHQNNHSYNVFFSRGWVNKVLSYVKSFMRIVSSLARPVMLGLSKFISFIQSHKVIHTAVDWALKGKWTSLSSLLFLSFPLFSSLLPPFFTAWKMVDNIQPVLPYAASMDDMVAIAGRMEATADGKLSWLRDLLPGLSENVTKVFIL
jgi:hypothetical protein